MSNFTLCLERVGFLNVLRRYLLKLRGKRKDRADWWRNEDGTLKCFGHAHKYNEQSFHCCHLLDSGDCNRALQLECWKRSDPAEIHDID